MDKAAVTREEGFAGAVPNSSSQTDGRENTMAYIDAHVHVWTDDTEAYPLAPGFSAAHMKPATFPPEELLAHANPCGVDRIVLIQMSYYGFDNSYMVDTMQRFPGVFGGVAVIDHEAEGVKDEMARLRGVGVRGLRIQPGRASAADWLSAGDWPRLLGAAGDLGMAVCALIDPEFLPAVGRAAGRFPRTTFVIDHLARIGCGRPIMEADIEALCALAAQSNCLVKVSAFYALGAKAPPHDDLIPLIRQVHAAFGADRLMWATDCPFQVQDETYQDSLSLVRDRLDFLSEADKAAVLGQTAQRVFFAQ